MKKSRSIAPKSPLGRILAADGASIPILWRGGISAWVRLEKDDSTRHEARSGFGGPVKFSRHIFFKIPLSATQRDIRAAVKELLNEFSVLRGVLNEEKLRGIVGCFEDGRRAIEKIDESGKRSRALKKVLSRVADIADLAADKTIGELRQQGHAPYGSHTLTAALRRARNRWIRRRYEELGREGLKDFERCNRIREEIVSLLDGGKGSAGRSSWKRDPYPLEASTILKIISHKRM